MRNRPVRYGKQLAVRFTEAQIRQIDRYVRDYSVDGRTAAIREILAMGLAFIAGRENKAVQNAKEE